MKICLLSFVADIENRELASWRSLEVIDTLLVLAEGGHTHAVKELFAVPQAHCPGKALKVIKLFSCCNFSYYRMDPHHISGRLLNVYFPLQMF